jgi:selenium metabolism protein YedF
MKIDARGKQCPLPVIEAKEAINSAASGEIVEISVDNEIATQNLRKLAQQKGLSYSSEKISERDYLVKITVSGEAVSDLPEEDVQNCNCLRQGVVAQISSDAMGGGDDALGRLLMKGFIFALSKQENPPETILLYNGGAKLSCEGSDSLEDLKNLEASGAKILTCGTCLNFYGLSEMLSVGSVTNMYEIADIMTRAGLLVRP